MQIYSDMTISGSRSALAELASRLDRYNESGSWLRNTTAEDDLNNLLPNGDKGGQRCFEIVPDADLPGAILWLDMTPDAWTISNIVPTGQSDQLTPVEYNRLLRSFRDYLRPLLSELEAAVSDPVLEVGPEHWLTPRALSKLHSFSALANKSTGASHPRDLTRWNAFVVAVHEDGCRIAADELNRILVEHEQWPRKKAEELSVLFEYEQSLLNDLAKTA